jgi:hypothetical protein
MFNPKSKWSKSSPVLIIIVQADGGEKMLLCAYNSNFPSMSHSLLHTSPRHSITNFTFTFSRKGLAGRLEVIGTRMVWGITMGTLLLFSLC